METRSIIETEIKELLEKIGAQGEIAVTEENGVYTACIKADDKNAPLLIGKYGETLNALQRILEAILYKRFGEGKELVVNVNDYREKQIERLHTIAENAASRAKSENQPVPLYSFSAYERKIIHEHIARAHPDITSYSEGEGSDRTLIVTVKKD